jgi:cytochrome P450 family 110
LAWNRYDFALAYRVEPETNELLDAGGADQEMARNIFADYVAWLFFPSRFLFSEKYSPRPPRNPSALNRIQIPGWETLELKTDAVELGAFNRLVGKEFLGGAGNAFLVPLFGSQSAFTLDGAQHRLARKLISQSINSASIEGVLARMPQFLGREFSHIDVGNEIGVGRIVRRLTMRTMCLSILGITDDVTFEQLLARFESATGYFANLVSYNKAFWYSDRKLSVGAEVKRRKGNIDAIVFDLIKARRKELSRTTDGDDRSRDLLSHLVASQSQHGYSDEFIRDNLVSTMAAGYDTTGSAITWMLFWLGMDNRSRRKLGDLHRTGSADYAPYVEAFVSESLRYCPPLEIMPRRPASHHEPPSRARDDEPTLVCPCPHRIHHDSAIYCDPEQFQPERFLQRKFAATEYFPFGLGNRLCLGIVLAPEIMKATLDWFVSREIYLHFRQTRFRPIRRNVSLWSSFRTKAKVMRIEP